MSPNRDDLLEPLLSSTDEQAEAGPRIDEEEGAVSSPAGEQECATEENDEETQLFSVRTEISEMLTLGVPLAVSFFCRMGMASTDSAFVGHIHDGLHSAEIYLAAAVLSDMCVNVFVTPPLAFNQVLNGLVGQAMGSGNPKMAGIWLQQSIFWLSVSMLPFLLAFFYVEPILIALNFPEDIAQIAGTYAKYNLLWPVPNGIYQCMRFYFQAQGIAKPAMYNNIIFLFVNALLNWIFVFGGPFKWGGFGFIGAAISLSISRTLQSVVYFFYMFVYKKNHLATWPDAGWSFKHHTLDRTKEFMKQSLPNIGTLLFQCCASQAQTILVGRLGESALAASSALSTVSIPWSGTLSATCTTISGVRTGFHMGRGDGKAAKHSAWMVLYFITAINIVVAFIFLPLRETVLSIATDDKEVISIGKTLVPAMLIGTYLNLLVSNITSGVFSGMGRPLIATVLSFGLELPMSIGGVAIYIFLMHGNLLGTYWWGAISGGVEILIVFYLFVKSDWNYWAAAARLRQEAGTNSASEEENTETATLVDAEETADSNELEIEEAPEEE